MKKFDYESKMWGVSQNSKAPWCMGALRIKYCLESLVEVKGRVLDIGCGAGGITKALGFYRKDLSFYGCDISKKAIEAAKESPNGVKFKLGDAYKLPYKSNYFDAVVLFDLLEHVENPFNVVKEVKRVLKRGGIFHAYVPCEGSNFSYVYWLDKVNWKAKEIYAGHIQRLKEKDIEKNIEKEGFIVLKRRWSEHIFFQIMDLLYFSFLGIKRKNVSSTLEGIVQESKNPMIKSLFNLVLKTASILFFYESLVLSKIPGMGIHLTTRNSRFA